MTRVVGKREAGEKLQVRKTVNLKMPRHLIVDLLLCPRTRREVCPLGHSHRCAGDKDAIELLIDEKAVRPVVFGVDGAGGGVRGAQDLARVVHHDHGTWRRITSSFGLERGDHVSVGESNEAVWIDGTIASFELRR